MIAFIQFAVPALLGGIAVAALPLLIHLLLRPRPRRVVFPAVNYLRMAFASGQRAQRLRNLWLMLMRGLLLACLALVLADPTCAPEGNAPALDAPVAVMIVIDDAWSMRYEAEPRHTLLDDALDAALTISRDAQRWPAGSELGVVWADASLPAVELTDNVTAVRAALESYQPSAAHADTLKHAVQQAASLLQAARSPRRRLIILTDLCAHAWRDLPPGVLAGIDGLGVEVRNLAPAGRSNIALRAAEGPCGIHPENAPIPIRVAVHATGLPATCHLAVREAQRVVERIGPFSIPADGSYETTLELRARPAGIYGLALEVQPDDRLPYDQRRFVAVQTGPRPIAWLVAPPERPHELELTTLILQNLLAPGTLAPGRQLVEFHRVSDATLAQQQMTAEDDHNVDLIVVPGGVELNEAARNVIRQCVESGTTLLLVPSGYPDASDWPGLRRLLARAPRNRRTARGRDESGLDGRKRARRARRRRARGTDANCGTQTRGAAYAGRCRGCRGSLFRWRARDRFVAARPRQNRAADHFARSGVE